MRETQNSSEGQRTSQSGDDGTSPVTAPRSEGASASDDTLGNGTTADTGHHDPAVSHPSQAEGEDRAEPDQHRDPQEPGHPSPAEG